MLYIILPVYNRKQLTCKFVKSLKRQSFRDYHLFLIDDGSTDGTDEMVRDRLCSEKLTIIKGRGNWWWAGSLQQGIDCLKTLSPNPSDVILLINDDVSFEKDFLLEGVKYLRVHPKTMVLAQFCDESSGAVLETGVQADLSRMKFKEAKSPDQINCLSTRGLFTTWDVIKTVGDFHPVLLPHYFSDYEYTIRAMRKGIALRTSPQIVLSPALAETGFRDDGHCRWEVRKLFSKKSAINPFYASVFIFLTCQVRAIPYSLIKVWGMALLKFSGIKRTY